MSAVPDEVKAVEQDLLAQAAENIETHRKSDVAIRLLDAEGRPMKGLKVAAAQKTHDYLFGCIIFPLVRHGRGMDERLEHGFRQRFLDLLNFAVFPFYWSGYEPHQGATQWERMLPTIEWCQSNGITTKGHPLVWAVPPGMPRWLEGIDPAAATELSRARVRSIVGGFAGRIDIWDVVNEAIHVPTWHRSLTECWGQQPWALNTDDAVPAVADYVQEAFCVAHDANPHAHLILNEYGLIAWERDREAFLRLVAELKGRGTPISGLGVQAHEPRSDWYAPQATWDTYTAMGDMGYPVHVTEYTPHSSGKQIEGGWRTGTWDLETQADFAEQFFRLTFGHPATVSLNWWGLSDLGCWLEGGGLVDDRMRPKPVYERLHKLIHEEWKTKVEAVTGDDGTFAFRGFFGRYGLEVAAPSGAVRRLEMHVQRNEANARAFTLR
jgi:GH35 family endo-1,4-beta-xylanase